MAATFIGPLHLLVNHAGIGGVPTRQLSADGHDLHFATNHRGH